MKGFFKKTILLFAMIGTVSFFAACGAKVTDISMNEESLSQTVYVQGQELSLDGVTFTANTKKGPTEVSLTDPEVLVSGYDSNKLGEQTITVTYQEQITSFKITVVPRMTVKNLKTSYFVGEPLDLTVGEVKIVKDDGSSFTVPVSSDKLTVTGFDSTTPKTPLTLALRYKDSAKGEDYTGAVDVNIHAVDKVATASKKPNKYKYGSHETKLDFTGAYLKLKNAGGTYTKDIPLTEDIAEGFNPQLATKENTEDNPLIQKITVSYAGEVYLEFDIQVVYSDVSYIKELAEELADYDWYGEKVPTLTDAEKDAAVDAMQRFLNLKSKDKAYITADEEEILARPAAYFGTEKWIEAAKTFSDTFNAVGGQFALYGKSYEKTKADFARLEEEDEPFIVLGEMLMELKEEYGDLSLPSAVFAEGVEEEKRTVESLLSIVYDPAELDDIKDMVAWMFEVYETLKDVPKTWNNATLNEYGADIQLLVAKLGGSEYQGGNYRSIYKIITSWRSDFFDIIYTYYYNRIIDENDKTVNISSLDNMKNIYLPGDLEELFVTVSQAVNQVVLMTNGKAIDSTSFVIYFEKAWEQAIAIDSGDNEMCKYLFGNLKFDGILNQPASIVQILYVLRTTNYGYYQHMSGMVTNEAFSTLWESYLEIFNKLNEVENYINSTEFATAVTDLFNAFVDMHPSEQYAFIVSINVFYENEKNFPEVSLILDPEQKLAYNNFAGLLHTYYRNVLKATGAEEVFEDLLAAIEYYANGYMKADAFTSFVSAMETVKTGYTALADKTAFDSLLGNTYNKYLALYDEVKNNQKYTHELEGAVLDNFNALVKVLGDASKTLETFDSEKYPFPEFIKFFTVAEKASLLESTLLADEKGAEAYYKSEVTLNGKTTTLEFAMYQTRKLFEKYLTGLQLSGGIYVLLDVYESSGMRAFVVEAYDIVWFDSEAELTETVKAEILDVMTKYRALSAQAKSLFMSLDNKANAYYEGLQAFFEKALDAESATTASLLIEVEKAHFNYELDPDGKNEVDKAYSEIFCEAFEKLKTHYEALEDKTSFDALLSTAYAYYLEAYAELTTEA
ncbi:MAG: bacterial Ig-like domain-containing protein [Clostridia bacterium]|nr:bacterial Ig-like domain-containing protein [Clostridia bacterium]